MDIGGLIKGGLKTALNVVTGGLGGTIWDIVEGAVGDDLAPDQKAALKIAIEGEITKRQIAAAEAAAEAEAAVTRRAAELEGTASDLRSLPIVGRLILFLRGCQRPAWGFATLVVDWQVFSGAWFLPETGPMANAFWAINILVLGFLFGERTILNLMPAITAMMTARGKTNG